MSILPKALNPDLARLKSKGIKSVKAWVINILPLLKQLITIEEFEDMIVSCLKDTKVVYPSKELIAKAQQQLAQEKFSSWEWNYGRSPAFNLTNKVRIEGKGYS